MALIDLLYRCPRCGFDPLPGMGEAAECPACQTVYARSEGERGIRVSSPGGTPAELPPQLLAERIEAMGGALPDRSSPDGEIRRARVRMQRSDSEDPLRWGGRLVGYVERFQEPVEGDLRITPRELEFLGSGGEPLESWALSTLAAVQGASSAIQIRGEEGTLFQFRFLGDSPRRWESLLRIVVAEARRRDGLGEVMEFQPRITSR